MSLDYFVTLARYNRWANQRLYAACAALPEAEYMQPRAAFFGSLHGTLNHILVADRLWLARILHRPPPALALDQILYGDLVALRVAREAEDDHIIQVVRGLSPGLLEEPLAYRTTQGVAQRTELRFVLGHLFNHQTHHRGQAHGLISNAGAEPPPLDLVFYLRTPEYAAGT